MRIVNGFDERKLMFDAPFRIWKYPKKPSNNPITAPVLLLGVSNTVYVYIERLYKRLRT